MSVIGDGGAPVGRDHSTRPGRHPHFFRADRYRCPAAGSHIANAPLSACRGGEHEGFSVRESGLLRCHVPRARGKVCGAGDPPVPGRPPPPRGTHARAHSKSAVSFRWERDGRDSPTAVSLLSLVMEIPSSPQVGIGKPKNKAKRRKLSFILGFNDAPRRDLCSYSSTGWSN